MSAPDPRAVNFWERPSPAVARNCNLYFFAFQNIDTYFCVVQCGDWICDSQNLNMNLCMVVRGVWNCDKSQERAGTAAMTQHTNSTPNQLWLCCMSSTFKNKNIARIANAVQVTICLLVSTNVY